VNSNKELHYRYIVSYLIVAIIFLITFAYYDVPDLVDKFSFALTLSSLLLSILAIFYTIISAQKQDIQLTKLVENNSNLDDTADEIKSAAQEIRSFAREAPQHFEDLGHKLDNISANYETFNSTDMFQANVVKSPKDPISIDGVQFARMVLALHYKAMAVLYLFEQSFVKDKNIEADTFMKLGICSLDYAMGILIVFHSIDLISFKICMTAIVPVSCATVVKDEIHTILQTVSDSIKGRDAEQYESLRKWMSAIEAHVA
jgi:hypothetical protein